MNKTIRKVNLIDYLPQFIQCYREIKNIMEAENPDLQFLFDEAEKIKNNQYIVTSDIEGIARFEKLLNIEPSVDDTLQSRISRILVRWNDMIPYTWRMFINKMDTLCGLNNYTLISNFKKYELVIITHLELYGQTDELKYLLDNMLPANILVKTENKLNYTTKGNMYIAMGIVITNIIELTDVRNNSKN